MDMQGEIHVWTEGDKARATLTLVGPEGQVTLTAEAPLAAARGFVERMLANRGKNIAVRGEEQVGELVDQVGRSRALRLLRRVAPALFLPAGYLSVAAARRLARRRRRRNRPVRPVTPWRGKRLGPAPEEPLPTGPEAESPEPQDAEAEAADRDAAERADEEATEGDAAAGIGAAQSAVPAAALAASPQLQAGVALLSAAKTSPKAARKVRSIFRRARRGDPGARKKARVLVAAQKAQDDHDEAISALVKHGTEPAPSAQSSPERLPPLLPAMPSEAVVVPPPPPLLLPPPPDSPSARGVFETWRRGIV
jgi:hypothetical protein